MLDVLTGSYNDILGRGSGQERNQIFTRLTSLLNKCCDVSHHQGR